MTTLATALGEAREEARKRLHAALVQHALPKKGLNHTEFALLIRSAAMAGVTFAEMKDALQVPEMRILVWSDGLFVENRAPIETQETLVTWLKERLAA